MVGGLLIKILLAAFAFVVAVLGVSDLKTVKEHDAYSPRPWWRRVTGAGKAKIACALATLALSCLNEYWSYTATKAAAEKADLQAQGLRSRLDRADRDMLSNIQRIAGISGTNGYLRTPLGFSP